MARRRRRKRGGTTMKRCHFVKGHKRCRRIKVGQRGGSLRRYVPPKRRGGHRGRGIFSGILTGLSLLPLVKPMLKTL